MKKTLVVMTGLILTATAAFAGGAPNDVGTPPLDSGIALSRGASSNLDTACPSAATVTTAFTGNNTQTSRLFRDAVPSGCPSKVFPTTVPVTVNYETFSYQNNSVGPACVTVNFDPDTGASPCGVNAFASAYLGTYDPAIPSLNYLGDSGGRAPSSFSVQVPESQSLVLVFNTVTNTAICDFTFQLVNLPCNTWRTGEADLGSGWKWTSWFGFYNTTNDPWVYHAQHGWLYPYDSGNGSVIFWYFDMQRFVWTSPTIYPFLYRYGADQTWLWYSIGSANPRLFYNNTSGIWESLP